MPHMADFSDGDKPAEAGAEKKSGDFLGWLSRGTRTALDKVTLAAGYSVALGCRHREPPMPAGMIPLEEYPESECAMDPNHGPCAPIRCPLAQNGISAVVSGGVREFMERRGWGARSDGVGRDKPDKGQPGP